MDEDLEMGPEEEEDDDNAESERSDYDPADYEEGGLYW